jgi:hypothetical protein
MPSHLGPGGIEKRLGATNLGGWILRMVVSGSSHRIPPGVLIFCGADLFEDPEICRILSSSLFSLSIATLDEVIGILIHRVVRILALLTWAGAVFCREQKQLISTLVLIRCKHA